MSRHQTRGKGRNPAVRLRRMREITTEFNAEKARWQARMDLLKLRGHLFRHDRMTRRSAMRYLTKLNRLEARFYRIIATGNLKEYWLL